MEVEPQVRRATAADVPELARMLMRAFFDDPVAGWACPSDALRPSSLERFQAIRLRQLLAHDEVWTTDDLRCAALWAPPARWKSTLREDAALVRIFNHPRLLLRMPLVGLGWLDLERRHPVKPPHWYLAVLGTDPDAQGNGLGSRVLGAVLEQCDRDGVGAYLESSKERNIDFYARHGFRVTRELKLLRGPTMWAMWREPRS
ncbi:MAG TPA: GNAT family N-acetyltransferase [Solirubrobacteraceae bacterium]|jgi:ribosomal protein S18 acetylase RimI-like enzyme|nr:GNAT family N-acetyltransferase [Solirubrobacteraceae bacterium]